MARLPRTLPRGKCPHCGKGFALKMRIRNHPTAVHRAGSQMGFMPQKYCSRACSNQARTRGSLDKHGYKLFRGGKRGAPDRYEHRMIMERLIGRPLFVGETVHHKNGKRADNRHENLELWSSRHGKGQRVDDRINDALRFLSEHGRIQQVDPSGMLSLPC